MTIEEYWELVNMLNEAFITTWLGLGLGLGVERSVVVIVVTVYSRDFQTRPAEPVDEE